jgi:ribosomal subunit interface protein
MKLQITFKNFEVTPALKEQIEKKTQKLKKFLGHSNTKANWYCWIDKDTHYAELQISGHQGPVIMATAKSGNLYKTLDIVLKKTMTQVNKKNRKGKMGIGIRESLLSA